ncbi:hypothetical protein REPUB_Repub19eG0016200 [Reevesia pubescens]
MQFTEETMADDLVSDISHMLATLSPISPDGCISKVPNYFRKVNKNPYEPHDPHRLAIGPYHRGKVHLQAMEEHKLRYLQILLQEREEINDVSKYVEAMRDLEPRARNCYTDTVNLESDDFVKMMLLDSCFIVQLFRMSFDLSSLRVDNDPIFQVSRLRYTLLRDLLLLENQIPFFVVLKLIRKIGISDELNFFTNIFIFWGEMLPGYWRPDPDYGLKSIDKIKHLLDLIHVYWRPSISEFKKAYENEEKIQKKVVESYLNMEKMDDYISIRCATELKEAGIKFRKVKGKSLFDIKYENGILEIPTLKIDETTNYFFRNLVAFEQLFQCADIHHVTDYTRFMDCLINSAKDVEILIQDGIIENILGDDEAAATMFNRLNLHVVLHPVGYYSEIYGQVNKYCSRRCNKWLANLNHNYFNSPWTLISVLAAAVILLLTLLQTIFSGIAL